MKFKPDQEVICPQFLINGSRLDMSAVVQRYIFDYRIKRWVVEVLMNGVYITLNEDRLVDSKEFWDKKKET